MICIWVKETLGWGHLSSFFTAALTQRTNQPQDIWSQAVHVKHNIGDLHKMSCVSTSYKTKQTEYVKQSRIHILIIANSFAYVQLFCREGPDSHSGRIGLRYPEHFTDIQRRDTQTSADPSHGAIWRCHEWICAWKRQFHVTVTQWHPLPAFIQKHLHCAQRPLTVPKSMSRRAALAPSTRMFFGVPWSASYM